MPLDASFKWTFHYSLFDLTYLDSLAAVAVEGCWFWLPPSTITSPSLSPTPGFPLFASFSQAVLGPWSTATPWVLQTGNSSTYYNPLGFTKNECYRVGPASYRIRESPPLTFSPTRTRPSLYQARPRRIPEHRL